MSSSNVIPEQIEEVLVTHRRGFLKSAGMLALSFGMFGEAARLCKRISHSGHSRKYTKSARRHVQEFRPIFRVIAVHNERRPLAAPLKPTILSSGIAW